MDTSITLAGYVGQPPELRTLPNNGAVATLRVASTPHYRNREGQWVDGETTWMTVRGYGALAQNIAASFYKGDPVLVHGRLRTDRWQNAQGDVQERLVVEASSLGHDLSRGIARFTRLARPSADVTEERYEGREAGVTQGPVMPQDDHDDGDGDVIDLVTGEVTVRPSRED